MRDRIRRTMALLLACVMVITGISGDMIQAATARATTMKLDSYTGKVAINTMNGSSRKAAKGMRLLNGYEVGTGSASNAFINLDDVKAVKMAEKSKVQVRQAGKKMDLRVITGELFFNVSDPLKKNETMKVSSSSMIAGVRGTSAYVKVQKELTKLYLIEGKLQLQRIDPKTNKAGTVTIQGGQSATFYRYGENKVNVVMGTFSERDLPAFVLDEIARNEKLQDKIASKSPLSVPTLLKIKEYLDEGYTVEEIDEKLQEEQQDGGDMGSSVDSGALGGSDDNLSDDTGDASGDSNDEDTVDDGTRNLITDGYLMLEASADKSAMVAKMTSAVVGPDPSVSNVVIPKVTPKGYTITHLSQRLFSSFDPDTLEDQNNTQIASVKILADIISVPMSAFEGCSNLKNVELPETIETIDWGAFSGCESLEEIKLPSSLKTIEEYAFSGCKALRELTIPDGIVEIDGSAFSSCSEELRFSYKGKTGLVLDELLELLPE